jgi:hypothetical protein
VLLTVHAPYEASGHAVTAMIELIPSNREDLDVRMTRPRSKQASPGTWASRCGSDHGNNERDTDQGLPVTPFGKHRPMQRVGMAFSIAP